MAGRIRTGMAGWVFPEWRGGAFYPEGLKQKEELHFASRAVTAIEINATFYSNQKPASFRNWAARNAARTFVFTVKGHQLVTHLKKLKDVEIPLANFFASGVLALGQRLGPICWQLPGNLEFDPERIESFLKLLPHTAAAARRWPKSTTSASRRHTSRPRASAPSATPSKSATRVSPIRPSSTMLRAAQRRAGHRRYRRVALRSTRPPISAICRLQGAPGADHYEPKDLDDWAKRLDAPGRTASRRRGRHARWHRPLPPARAATSLPSSFRPTSPTRPATPSASCSG